MTEEEFIEALNKEFRYAFETLPHESSVVYDEVVGMWRKMLAPEMTNLSGE